MRFSSQRKRFKTTRNRPPPRAEIQLLNRWIAQRDDGDDVRAVVCNLIWMLDLPVTSHAVERDLPMVEGYPNLGSIRRYMAGHGVPMRGLRVGTDALDRLTFPAVAQMAEKQFVIVIGSARGRVFLLHTLKGWQSISHRAFAQTWTGVLLVPSVSSGRRPARCAPDQTEGHGTLGSQIGLKVIDDAFSADQCEDILAILQPFRKSRVATQDGAVKVRSSRTSRSAQMPTDHPLTRTTMELAARLFGVPILNCENPTVLSYAPLQEFGYHHDAFSDEARMALGHRGNRLATAIFYLNDNVLGGETHFPAIDLKIAPRTGRAAIWRNLGPDGEIDNRAIHAGLPVYSGRKYVMALHVWTTARQ